MKPIVSIVIPVYNVEEHLLRKCIESCMSQDMREIEIILVDDKSPGKCGAICDEYAFQDSRIIVIHKEENGGLSAARNIGVRNATGEWLTFVDGDDWIDHSTCNLVENIKDPTVELVFFGMVREYEKSSTKFDFPYMDGHLFNEEECKQLQIDVLDYNKRMATAYCKFVRMDYIKKYEIMHDEEVQCGIEGIEYNLRLFGKLKKAVAREQYLYHYVYNLDSITGAPSDRKNQFILLGFARMEKYISGLEDSTKLEKQFQKRVQRGICDAAVGCYFNPNYNVSYRERKKQFNAFMSNSTVCDVVNNCKCTEQGTVNKIIYMAAVHKLYLMLKLLGYLRIRILASR